MLTGDVAAGRQPTGSRRRGAPRPVSRLARTSVWDWLPLPASLALVAAGLVLLWQLALWQGVLSEFVVPYPVEVGAALDDIVRDLLRGGPVWDNFLLTAQETLFGFGLAIALGVGLGVVTAETAFGRRVLQPFVIALYAVPKVALAPILVAWFGFGMTPKVIMAAIIAFFPLMIDTAAGLFSVERHYDKLLTSLRATRWQRFWKLKLPTALPFIFAGLKSASVLSVIGVLVAEYLGGGKGLGAMVDVAASQLAIDRVFAFVILLTVMSYALYLVVTYVERKVVFWRKSEFIPVDA